MDEETCDKELGSPQLDFPVVGIGASAGGLEAVTSMFQDIAAVTGMAYVLVMHLDPDHESMMAELLSKRTAIPVRQISDGDVVEVDSLHIIPPGSGLRIEDGKFWLEPFEEPRGLRRPVDSFFSSLAHVQGERAAAVILSGTGGDGTAGMRVVKDFGGVCAVQSPEEARYDGMPYSALSTKLVDFALPVAEMVERLSAYFEGTFDPTLDAEDENVGKTLLKICDLLKRSNGVDFAGYKEATLLRRLNRRLLLLNIDDIHQYYEHLEDNEEEQSALIREFLINVTSFFREREAFELVRRLILLPLIESKSVNEELRIWVPACSSGQEAYTIAMLVDQTCEELGKRPLIRIFATDIEEGMIETARRGRYPVSAAAEIPDHLQKMYVVGMDDRFEVNIRIREMIRFSVHDIVQDPPFSKLDFISCRNLLIYLKEDLQSEIFSLLHFSLRKQGHLLLGSSESIKRADRLFIELDKSTRLYRRNDETKRRQMKLPLVIGQHGRSAVGDDRRMAKELDFPRHETFEASNKHIYERYGPPFLRISKEGRIVDASGDLALFLRGVPFGASTLDGLARQSVNEVALPLIADAFDTGSRRAVKDVEIVSPFGTQKADIVADPMQDETVCLVFIVKDRLQPMVDEYEATPVSPDRRVADLQAEVQVLRQRLRANVEEIETANEELKTSNEEMMSMNEELQSANEELTTANDELKHKIEELIFANADLDNLLQSADLSMVVLDKEMRIRHLSDAARGTLPLKRSDEGRMISEFDLQLGGYELVSRIRDVIESGMPVYETVETKDGSQSLLLRITPYIFADGTAKGVTLSFVDITKEVSLRHELTAETEKLRSAMRMSRMGFWHTDLENGTVDIDEVAAEMTGLGEAGIYGRDAMTRVLSPEDAKINKELRQSTLPYGKGYDQIVRIKLPNTPEKWVQINANPYESADGRRKVAGVGLDVTELIQLQKKAEEDAERLQFALETAEIGVAELDAADRSVKVDDVLANQFGLKSAGVISIEEMISTLVEKDAALLRDSLERAITESEEYEVDFRVDVKGGPLRWLRMRGRLHASLDGSRKIIGHTIDVTANHQQQMLVAEMSHRVKNLFAVIAGLVAMAPKNHPDTEEMARTLLDRIVALGTVYDLARKKSASSALSLKAMLSSIVEAHATKQSVKLKGPEVEVTPNVLNTLTLVLHELTTNAAKYGALSVPDGALSISWSQTDKGRTKLKWKETVPGFTKPKEREGFGSTLISAGVEQLRGKIKRTTTKSGMKVQLSLCLSEQDFA